MKRVQGWMALLGVMSAGGCASMQTQPETTAGQAQHVVVCWLKPDGDREAVLHSANEFAKLPGVLDVRAGYKLDTAAADIDTTYDLTLVITFNGQSALQSAEKSPAMEQIVEGSLKENVAKMVVYDTLLQNYQVGKIFAEENEAATRQRRAAAVQQQQDQINHAK